MIPSGVTPNPAFDANMRDMLQAAELGIGPTYTGSMNSLTLAGIPANTIPAPSTKVMSEQALLQKFSSAAASPGISPSFGAATPHGQRSKPLGGPLNQAHYCLLDLCSHKRTFVFI